MSEYSPAYLECWIRISFITGYFVPCRSIFICLMALYILLKSLASKTHWINPASSSVKLLQRICCHLRPRCQVNCSILLSSSDVKLMKVGFPIEQQQNRIHNPSPAIIVDEFLHTIKGFPDMRSKATQCRKTRYYGIFCPLLVFVC